MPHSIDIDSIHKNVFLLLNICYGARSFAQHHDLESDEDAVGDTFYHEWLTFSLSELLIDTAIKTRIVLDMLRAKCETNGEIYTVDIGELDRKISGQHNIGYFIGNEAKVNIRESCNKIIHALSIDPIFEKSDEEHDLDEESDNKREWRYWEGSVNLAGQKNSEKWYLTLHVSDFCLALEELISSLESTVDWQTLHNDEQL